MRRIIIIMIIIIIIIITITITTIIILDYQTIRIFAAPPVIRRVRQRAFQRLNDLKIFERATPRPPTIRPLEARSIGAVAPWEASKH